MLGINRRFWILAAVLVAVNAAGVVWIHYDLKRASEHMVRLLAATLEPNTAAADRLSFVFDRSLVPETAVGQTEPVELFRLQPAWPGKWVWTARERIEYQVEKPLPPGRVFHAICGPAFAARTGRSLDGDQEIVFKTAALALEGCDVIATDDSNVTLDLTFNQPVDPGDLLRHLSFFDDKSSAPLHNPQCLTQTADKKLAVRSPWPPSGELRMVLQEQLAGYKAEVPLEEKVVKTFSVTPAFTLLSAGRDHYLAVEDNVTVRLHFSRTLNTEQKLPPLTITPALPTVAGVEKVQVHRRDNDLEVTGPFKSGVTYTFKVPGTLLDTGGKTLGEEKSITLEIGKRQPTISITHSRGVLSPRGNLLVDAKVVNVSALKITASRVHENNLVAHLHGTGTEGTSRSLGEKTVKLDFPPDVPQKVALDLREVVGNRYGIYSVNVTATDCRWTSDEAIVTCTDLAITAKRSRSGLLVWVTSLETGKPVGGALVKAVSLNNQVLASGKTDEHGIAALAVAANHPDGAPWAVIVEKDGDISYLELNDNQWMLDDVDQSGRPYAETYEVMLYPERGVYRPGDTVFLTGILRDGAGHVPPPLPLTVKVVRPDGREVADLAARTEADRQGVFQVQFTPREDAQTGQYAFRVTLPGDKKELGSCHALIEAFVPVRMEVKAKLSAARFGPADTPEIEVSGRYLWDQPAAKVPLTVDGSLTTATFASKQHPGFRFGTSATTKVLPLPKLAGELDEHGKSSMKVELPKSSLKGYYRVALVATVTEPGGRSVSDYATAVLDKLDRHIGMRLAAGQVVGIGTPVAVAWVRVTGVDAPAAPGEMDMQLARVEYDTVLKKVGDRHVWQSVERTDPIETREVKPGEAAGNLQVTCMAAGMYRVTLTDRQTGSASQLDFYASESGAGPLSLEMNRPERLQIILDKEKYLPGDTVRVLVRSPLAGTLLLTLETDKVVAPYVVEVAANSAELQVPLPQDLRGGAFITATVVRAVDPKQTSWLPHRAMGMARVVVDHTAQQIPLALTAPPKARPGEAVSITVETGAPSDPDHPALVHLWAVDEGILLAAAYQTPNAEAFFLRPRRPGVETADLFFCLLPDYTRPAGMTRIGADRDEFNVDKLRRSPVATRRREPAVIWRTAALADRAGRLTVEMKMPDLTGQMRLMAVAVDHDRYGRAEKPVTLTQPLIAEATWPRFAAPGDTFEVPLKLFNSTDRPIAVRAAVKITGPVQVAPDAALDRLEVKPGEPVTRFLKVTAKELGPVETTIEVAPADAPDPALSAHTTASFAVRPATALHGEVKLTALAAGEKFTFAPSGDFVKGTVRATVDVSARPGVHLGPALERLIHYPYGCVEQTSSQLLALVYAPGVLGPDRADAISQMVQAGIARLWSMQTRSGGLSYWPGDTHPCLWGTAYASTCLLEARMAGHTVEPRFTRELVKYMTAQLNSQGDNTTGDGEADENTKALITRVLAVFGDPPHGWMARLAEHEDKLDVAGRAHLAAAFFAAGRKDRALALLPRTVPTKDAGITTEGRLISPVRQDAVLLSVLLEIDPKNPLVGPLAARLEKARINGCWGTTLDNAGAIAALSRYQAAAGAEKPEFSGTIRLGQETPVAFDHTKPVSHKFASVAGPIEIVSSGTGTIYISVSAEGLATKEALKPYSHDLKVERRWFGTDGKRVDPLKLRVGDLVRVVITVSSPREVKNIAIVDALPGGMEVENPRLATSAKGLPDAAPDDSDRSKDSDAAAPADADATDSNAPQPPHAKLDRPDHVEFLDDRVVLFCGVGPKAQVFSYALRVIAAGEFDVPPIQASCMYDPSAACLGETGLSAEAAAKAGRVRIQK